MTKTVNLNRPKHHTAGVPFMNLLLQAMDTPNLSPLINGMYKTAKDGFSFGIFQEIFDLAGIESAVYLLTFEQLADIQPIPSIVYLKNHQCFVILDKIEQKEITFSTAPQRTETLSKSEFQQTWDGLLLPIDDDAFSTMPTVRMTSKNYQFDKNNYLEITAIPKGNHAESAFVHLGRLSTDAFVNESYFSFEAVLPACKGMTLVITSKNKTNQKEHIVSKYDIPISFDGSVNILRFHFAKACGQDIFNFIGLRGSIKQIFKVNEKS